MPRTALAQKLVNICSVAADAARRQVPIEEAFRAHAEARSNRRQFLTRMSAITAGGVLLPGAIHAAKPSAGGPRIAVVGAGLAGLACAYRLRQAGIVAAVYEANTRLGGRCWTQRGDFAEGQIAEHGGELIDQSHTEIRHLIQELGLATDNLLQAETNGTEPFYFFDGAPYSVTEAANDLKQIWQKMHRDLSEAGYPTTYDNYTPRGAELDQLSVIDWINETVPGGMGSRLGQLLDVAYNIEYGGESDTQSCLNLIYLLGYLGPGQLRLFGPSNEKYHVHGGNDQIVSRLAGSLPGQIVTGMTLVDITQTTTLGYALTFQSGRRTSVVNADKVVLTVPFSIMRAGVNFTRAGFSPLKQTSINELGMGTNTKMHLQFINRHWRELGCNGDTLSDRGYQDTWEVSRGQTGTAGILVNFTGGNVGNSFDMGTPASRAAQFLTQVEPVLPGLSAKWNGRVSIDYWPGNSFTRGSYSFWKVGQYTRFAGIEGVQEGNCHFAGEHTSIDAQGYLEGAVETGERAANEVLADLGARSR